MKTFFKLLKEGRKTWAIRNVFVTGMLPVTIDELTSGFNIATFITLESEFENMLGFTQTEADRLLDEIYDDYRFAPATRPETDAVVKRNYNGYHFVDPDGEPVYNSTILIYFLDYFTRLPTTLTKEIGCHLIQWNMDYTRRGYANQSHFSVCGEQCGLCERTLFSCFGKLKEAKQPPSPESEGAVSVVGFRRQGRSRH